MCLIVTRYHQTIPSKTNKSLQKITFPTKFSTSVNKKHYSNTEEVIKDLQENVIPYINEKRKSMRCWSICTTDLRCFSWPENRSSNFFPPIWLIISTLVLAINKWVQDFMKQNINKWFAIQLRNELESGKELENIMIKFILSTMKLFYAVWWIEGYNQLTLFHWKEIILASWKALSISAALKDGLIGFLIDPVNEIL